MKKPPVRATRPSDARRKRAGSKKIAISLPGDLLSRIEEDRARHDADRSAWFQTAAREVLDRRHRAADVEAYVRSYREMPETAEEIALVDASHQLAAEVLRTEDPPA